VHWIQIGKGAWVPGGGKSAVWGHTAYSRGGRPCEGTRPTALWGTLASVGARCD